MKKTIVVLLVMLMLLSLTACSGIAEKLLPGSNTLSSNGSLESIEPAATEPALTMDPSATEEPIAASDDLIYEYFQDDGEYEIAYDDTSSDIFYYSYHLPSITAATEGAEAINQSIEDTFGALIEQQYQAMEDGWYLPYHTISWLSSQYENLLVLLISAESNMEFYEYGVYCYELTTGEWLQGSSLLSYLHIEESGFLSATREAAEEYFISANEGIPAEDREAYGYDERLSWTISDENINLENLLFYPDAQGTMTVIARIGSMAGADWYYQYLYPEIAYG